MSAPTLLLMCGLPAAGKTTQAKRLELERGAVRLTPDDWIESILPADCTVDERDRLRDPVESLQWALAQRLLTLGVSVILDWGLWGRSERDVLRDGARALGARVEVHFLDLPMEELVARLAERTGFWGGGSPEEVKEVLARFDSGFQRPTEDELFDSE